MGDIVEFLRQRLTTDEADALAASPGPWTMGGEGEVLAVDGITVAEGFALSGRQLRATVDHIARHDPARVLRDVAAMRAILDEIVPLMDGMDDQIDSEFRISSDPPTPYASERLLRILAAIWADHPDFDPAWAVTE